MPQFRQDGSYWQPDFEQLAAMPGSAELAEWFGFVSDFHDAELRQVDQNGTVVRLVLEAFRMTGKADADGFLICDRHAEVTIHLSGVSNVIITSELPTSVFELAVRRVGGTDNLEISFDDVVDGGGSIIATGMEFSFIPIPELKSGIGLDRPV